MVRSPPGRRPNIKYPVNTSHRFDLCKYVAIVVLFGNNANSYTVCTQSDMCVYRYTYSSIQRSRSGTRNKIKKKKNIGTAACQENLSACHFGHACHRFARPWPPLFCKRFQTPHAHVNYLSITQRMQLERNATETCDSRMRASSSVLALLTEAMGDFMNMAVNCSDSIKKNGEFLD